MTIKQLNATSAKAITGLVKQMFGAGFYATAHKGRRRVVYQAPGSLCCDDVCSSSWASALILAHSKWGAQ